MNNLNLIAAVGQNRELGYQNKLIWRIKEDLQYFKDKTMNSYIIMGRKTYESLPKKLENRKYIVLTKNTKIDNDDILIFNDINKVLEFIESHKDKFNVIGGGEIYKLFLPYADTMYLTEINSSYKSADTYFPKFDKKDWEEYREELLYDDEISYQHVEYKTKVLNRNI